MSLILPTFDKRIKPPLGTPLNPHLPINDGLVGCWPMNEGAGAQVRDASGNGRHLTVPSGWTWVVDPQCGVCLLADGTNWMYIPFTAITAYPFTLVAAARVTAEEVNVLRALIGLGSGDYRTRYELTLANYTTSDYDRPGMNARFAGGSQNSNSGPYLTPELQRRVVVGVFASATSRLLYTNGSFMVEGTASTGIDSSVDVLAVGGSAYSGAQKLTEYDVIEFAAVYNRALTPNEIASLYADPWQGFRRPVIEWWGAVLDAPSGTDYSFTINDGMGVVDDRSNLASLIRSVAEGLGLSDNASSVSSLLRTLSDAMGIEDAESASAAIVRGLNEAVGLTDAKSKLSVAVRQVADSLGLVDSVGCLSVLLRTISDAEGVTDGQILSRMLVVADEIGAADEIGRVVAYLRTKSESVGLSDEMIEGATAAIAKTISDAMGLSDEAVRLSVVVRGVLDGIGIADAAQRLSVCLRVVTDSLGITDGTAMARSMAVAETMGLSSSWSKAVGYLRAQSDSMSLADDYASAWAVLRTIDETLGVTDQMIQEGVAVLVRIISDVVGATDSRSQVHEALRVLTESVATSDSVARLFAVSRVIAEVEGLTDVASRGRFYMIADTLGISDEVARLVGFLRSCDEGVGVIEAILRVSGVVRRLDDSMGVTDSEQHFLSGLVQAAMAFLILRKGR